MTLRLAASVAGLTALLAMPAGAQDPSDSGDIRRRSPRVEVIVPRHRTYLDFDRDSRRFHEPRVRIRPRIRVSVPRMREFVFREDAHRHPTGMRDELRVRLEDRMERLRDHQRGRAEELRRRAETLRDRTRERSMERAEDLRRRLEDRRFDREDRVRVRRDRFRSI
jgi:hypothetical protein